MKKQLPGMMLALVLLLGQSNLCAATPTAPATPTTSAATATSTKPATPATPTKPATPANETQSRHTLAPVRDVSRSFQVYPRNAKELRTEGIVMQERDFSCGAAALATVFYHQWQAQVTETQILVALVLMLSADEMRERIERGLSLTDLRRLSLKFGYQAVLGRLTIEKLRDSKIPLIVGITVNQFDHFVVYRGMDDQYVYLADPARGKIRVPILEFEKQWQKSAVLVIIKPQADLTKPSPLMATDQEKSLGIVTQQALRSQLTSRGCRF